MMITPPRAGQGTRHGRVSAAAALLAAGLLLGGCSGSESSTSGAPTRVGDAAAYSSEEAADRAGGAPAASPADAASELAVSDQKLIRSASISLQVKNIAQAMGQVRGVMAGFDGWTLSENVGSYVEGEGEGVTPDTYATVTMSVPADKLDPALDELQKIGEILDRRSSTQNVTAEFVDTAARVKAMERAVARIQDLIDQTKDIDQLVKLERELSTRQTELEGIQARLQELQRQTARSPITINLTTEPELVANLASPREGFVGGLQAGWKAFMASLVGLMAVIGALLPFAIFAGVIGYPLWRIIRAIRATRANKPPKIPPSGGPGPHPWAPSHEPPLPVAAAPTSRPQSTSAQATSAPITPSPEAPAGG